MIEFTLITDYSMNHSMFRSFCEGREDRILPSGLDLMAESSMGSRYWGLVGMVLFNQRLDLETFSNLNSFVILQKIVKHRNIKDKNFKVFKSALEYCLRNILFSIEIQLGWLIHLNKDLKYFFFFNDIFFKVRLLGYIPL